MTFLIPSFEISPEALRGKIGASMVKSRIMETSIAYILDVMNSEFTELKTMMQDSIKKEKGRWYNNINRYRQELKLTWDELLSLDRKALKKLIKIMIMTVGKMVYWKNQLHNSMQQKKGK